MFVNLFHGIAPHIPAPEEHLFLIDWISDTFSKELQSLVKCLDHSKKTPLAQALNSFIKTLRKQHAVLVTIVPDRNLAIFSQLCNTFGHLLSSVLHTDIPAWKAFGFKSNAYTNR